MNGITRRAWLAAMPPVAAAAGSPAPDPQKRILSDSASASGIRSGLLPAGEWAPLPVAGDPRWKAVPGDAVETVLSTASPFVGKSWPTLPATLILDYVRTGNRTRFESVYLAQRLRFRDLVVAECFENRGRFLDDIANGAWHICEETYWGLPAHLYVQRSGPGLPDVDEPIVDLFAAETGAMLAWTQYLLGSALERVSPLIVRRIRREIRRRILEPCLSRNFSWMGLDHDRPVGNWNPWIVSNWTSCALLLEPEPRRTQAVRKILACLDRFLDTYPPDGGCDEGPGYWSLAGGSLFDGLDLLYSASSGRLDWFGVPLIQEIGRYVYRVHIDRDWYVNFADALPKLGLRGDLIYRYGKRIGDPRMMSHGAYTVALNSNAERGADSLLRHVNGLLFLQEIRRHDAHAPYVRDVWLPGVGVMTARQTGGTGRGFFTAVQGGHNAENHNHNDVGNFVLFHDGDPILIDVGVESYTAKTFSPQRYEIWTMQSAFHNLPTVNGAMQGAGRQFAARDVECSRSVQNARIVMDISAAYPAEARLQSWRRAVTLDRTAGTFVLEDTWRLEAPAPVEWNFMTWHKPVLETPGTVRIGRVRLRYPASLSPAIDTRSFDDARLTPVWGHEVHRLRLRLAPGPAREGTAQFEGAAT